MKCWECKKKTGKAIRVNYIDGENEKTRDVCLGCEKQLTFDPSHFVEVERINRGQLTRFR